MRNIEKSIEVNCPLKTVYNQWTQFEDWPRFMEGVKSVRQLDDKHLQWDIEVAGKEKQFEAQITEQIPDMRICWESTSGVRNGGEVSFESNGTKTRVRLRMDYDPQGLIEEAGDAVGVLSARVQGDLKRFKEFIEMRGNETGAWRGQIPKHDA
jgi:uncharacterized membrane protein